MKLKDDVNDSRVSPVLGLWIGIIARHHLEWTNHELVVTSLRRDASEWPSLHVPEPEELVRAVDLRRWYLDNHDLADPFCRMLEHRYGTSIHVLLEPEWLSVEELERRGGAHHVDPHIHVGMRSNDWPASLT